MFARVRIALLACWGICLLATVPGCGGCAQGVDSASRKPVFPVAGELYFDGAPARNVMVIFQPADNAARSEVWPMGFPKANVSADGSFQVGTYEEKDGAPVGEYLILVIPVADLTTPQQMAGDSARPAAGAGPGSRFSSPDRPAGRYVVEAKENKIPRLSLTGGA